MRLLLTLSLVLAMALFAPQVAALEEGEPMTALELVQAGQAAFSQRDYEIAQAHFGTFLSDYGDSEEAQDAVQAVRPLFAICLIRVREFGQALEAIEQVLETEGVERAMRLELTFWKGVCQLQAAEHAEAQVSFGTYYKDAPTTDPRRFEAAVLFGTGYLIQEQYPEAIAFFRSRIEELEANAPEAAARMITLQLHALLQTNELEEAVALTLRASEKFDQFVQIIGLQSLILQLGSRLLDEERYYEAIRCFHYVWPQQQLIDLQTSRQERLEKRLRSLNARGNADALVFQLDGILTRITRELEHFSNVQHYNEALRMRLASAYLGLQRYRQGALIMEGMLAEMELNEIVEGASVNLVQCWMQEERWDRAAASADLYLNRFGYEAKSSATVLFMKGQACQSGRNYDVALEVFDECLERYPKGPLAANACFMRGICLLQLDRYTEAIQVFREVPVDFPGKEALIESAKYWEGMAHSFASEHERCLTLMQGLLKKYPQGHYWIDAKFRIAFSEHALAMYDQGITSLTAFIKDHADSPYVDEAKLLLGDAYFAQGELEDGMAAYASIAPESIRFFEEGYFKSGKALKLSERYDDMAVHYEKFVNAYPKSARLPEALHHLAWLKKHEGDLEGARLAYWRALDVHGDDAEKPTVLDLILGLQKLYDGDEREALSTAWAAKRAKALRSKQVTYAVRSLWARGMLLQPRSPAQAAVFLRQMSPELNPEIHSARLLVDVADAFAQTGALPEAASVYQDIVKWHPNALERDRAEVGLGHEAMRTRDYAKALSHFSRVERRQSGIVPLGKLLLLKASCQDLAGDRRAGLKTLEGLLAEKSVTSGHKAEALMRSGQWLADGKEATKALAYFERVYLVYGRYESLVSTAYWSRGQLLEKLGEPMKAQEVYREFVAREELKAYPEYALAKERMNG